MLYFSALGDCFKCSDNAECDEGEGKCRCKEGFIGDGIRCFGKKKNSDHNIR